VRTGPIRLLIVDDHPAVRAGLSDCFRLRPDFEVLGTAVDGQDGLVQAMATTPDVVLLDLSMPSMDGIEATQRIRASCPNTKVVLLTSFNGNPRVQAALAAGASDYVTKDSTTDEIAQRLRQAVDPGETATTD
jgi:two-component system NarL family response regulator